MADYYEWFKAIHLFFVISWMAGMFYLPRLFVYHTEVEVGSEEDKRFQRMEKKLLRIIINPSMVGTIIFGLILGYIYGFIGIGIWFHLKMLCVFFMIVLHILFSRWRKNFERGENKRSAKFYAFFNELPPITLIVIIWLVILKPFE